MYFKPRRMENFQRKKAACQWRRSLRPLKTSTFTKLPGASLLLARVRTRIHNAFPNKSTPKRRMQTRKLTLLHRNLFSLSSLPKFIMNRTFPTAVILSFALCGFSFAEPPSDEGKPASSNVPGQAYPKIDAEGRAAFRIPAPQAAKVQVRIDRTYDLTKDEKGVWTGVTGPLVPGFHYYSLLIDGVETADPASETYFGSKWMHAGIEVPEKGVDFYDVKNVPHGEVRQKLYFSKTANAWRRCFVYTPPKYDACPTAQYPVLYLQHGWGEDERGWVTQGRVNLIIDNLIAEGKCVPMIVVIDNGNIGEFRRPQGKDANKKPADAKAASAAIEAGLAESFRPFEKVVIEDLIPTIDSTYRTVPDREHRAMAGLSMGGMQTYVIALKHLDAFAYIGGFSGGGIGIDGEFDPKISHGGVMADAEAFNKQVRLLWLSVGTAEGPKFYEGLKKYRDAVEKAGVKIKFYESPGTAHEWLTWRRSLHEFAPLLFRCDDSSSDNSPASRREHRRGTGNR